jgi:autotransporter-associated beta strand protein
VRFARLILFAIAVSALVCAEGSFAATKTWSGFGGSTNWSSGGNWSPLGAPGSGDTVVFNSAVTSNADLSVAIGAIVFGANSGGSVITGAVAINAAAATVNIDDQSTSTSSPNVITASINNSNAGSALYVKSGVVGHVLELRGVISGGPAAGVNALRIYGPGTVRMNASINNTYPGDTSVASADAIGGNGLLQLAGAAQAVIPGALIVGTGTTASSAADRPQAQWLISQVLADTSRVTVGPDGLLALNASSETIAQLTGTGTVTGSNTLGTLTVGDTGDFTWGGVISGPGNVTKVGSGTLTIGAPQDYTGATNVNLGTIILATPANIRAIAAASPIAVGAGTGALGSNAATLRTANTRQIDRPPGAGVTVRLDGRLELFHDESLDAVTIQGGNILLQANAVVQGILSMSGGTISGAGILVTQGSGSNVVATSTSTFGVATIDSGFDASASARTITVNSGSTQPELTINGKIRGVVAGTAFTKNGSGTLRLAGTDDNIYSGEGFGNGASTTVAQGVLELAKPDNVVAVSGPIVIGNGTDPAGSATLRNLASNQLLDKPSVQINPSGVYQVSNSSTAARTETIGALSGNGKLFVPFRPELTIDFASGVSTFTGPVDDPSPNATGNKRINKRGGGTQVFTADANYDGFLIPYEGELRVNGQIPNAPVSLQGGTLSGTGRVENIDVTSGTIRPGSGSGGTLTANTVRMGFSPQTKLLIDIASASPGGFGKLNVQSVLDPNAGLDPARIEVNPIGGYVPPLGTTIEVINKSSGGPATSRFRNSSVAAGAHNMAVSYSGGDGNDVTLTAAKTLDVDGDGEYSATTDALLISRFIGGITSGTALTANAVAASNGAKRTTQIDVAAYLTHLGNALNVSQNTSIESVDSVLILRWLLGFRDTALVTGLAIPPGSTAEQYADQIRNLLEQVTP